MATEDDVVLSDKSRLLFGAGFVFGVAFTMLVLAIVTSTVARERGQRIFATEIIVTIGAGIFFAAVVGIGLYYLAFPENRVEIPIGDTVLAGTVEAESEADRGAGAAAEGDDEADP